MHHTPNQHPGRSSRASAARRTLSAALAVAGVATLLAVAPALGQRAGASLSFAPCGTADVVVECANFVVAERPGDTASRQLSLRIVRLRQERADPATTATFLLPGGPGQRSSDFARGDLSLFVAWAEHGDVIFMDQRGTEEGSPLRCPGAADFDAFAGIFPAEPLSRCREEAARVADLGAYGTDNAAADIEAARVALGYDQVNFVSVSYGTRLALHYIERFPDRVRAAVLDGVVPRDLRAPLHYVADAEAALGRISELCSADTDCRQHGDPAVRFRSVMARLAAAPATVAFAGQPGAPERQAVFGPTHFAYSVRGILYGNGAVSLPHQLAHADSTGDLAVFARQYAQRAVGIARGVSLGLHLSVLCAEDVATLAPRSIEEATAATVAGSYLVDQYVEACRRWRVQPSRTGTATARITRPLLLLSGALDPVTPPRWADLVRNRSTQARHVIFPYGAHSVPGEGMAACKARIVQEFLRTARPEELDVGCVASAPRPRFTAPG